jgi:hypothetical protein
VTSGLPSCQFSPLGHPDPSWSPCPRSVLSPQCQKSAALRLCHLDRTELTKPLVGAPEGKRALWGQATWGLCGPEVDSHCFGTEDPAGLQLTLLRGGTDQRRRLNALQGWGCGHARTGVALPGRGRGLARVGVATREWDLACGCGRG